VSCTTSPAATCGSRTTPVPSVGELTGLAGDPRPEVVPRTLCDGGAGLPATGGEVEAQVTACQGTRATPV
jgi:hypothetical protein